MKPIHKKIMWLAVAFAALGGLLVPTFSKLTSASFSFIATCCECCSGDDGCSGCTCSYCDCYCCNGDPGEIVYYDIGYEPTNWYSSFDTKWKMALIGEIVATGSVPIADDYSTPHFRRVYQDADPGPWCHGAISFDGLTITSTALDGKVQLYLTGVTPGQHAWYNFEVYLTNSEDQTIVSYSTFFGFQVED